MTAREPTRRGQAPIFIHDQRPQFRVNARSADRACIPTGSLCLDGLHDRLDTSFLIRLRVLCGAVLNRSSLVRRELPLHFFKDRRQAGFSVGRECERWAGSSTTATTAGPASTSGTGTWSDAAKADVGDVATEQCRKAWTGDGSLSTCGFQTQRVIVRRAEAGTA